MEAIHLYAAGGNITGLMGLLQRDPSLVDARGQHGFTPLHFAATERHVDIAEALLSCSAEINSLDVFGRTPLLLSIYEEPLILDRVPIITILISKGAEVNFADKTDRALLYMAATFGEADCIELLLRAGADVNVWNAEGNTPLHGAALYSNLDTAAILLKQPGIDVHTRNNAGLTPYELAEKKGWTKFVKLIAGLVSCS